MQFLICPVPKLHLLMLDASALFYSRQGTAFYYSISFTNDKVVISDTLGRSVIIKVSQIEELLQTAINSDKECVYVMCNGFFVPFEVSELPHLARILQRIVTYTNQKRVLESILISNLVRDAEV